MSLRLTLGVVAVLGFALPVPASHSQQQPAPSRDTAQARAAQTPRPRRTAKPPLHARHWIAITGKPLGATAGAMMFQKGGNAVDAACAMLAAVTTMWDVLSWGGETQALIYHPGSRR